MHREYPCLIHQGPPRLMLWPKMTLEVRGQPIDVDALARIGDRDPQWFVLELGSRENRHLRELMLDMPVISLTSQDVARPDFMAHLLSKIQRSLPRKAA